jgi:hypothetical protein
MSNVSVDTIVSLLGSVNLETMLAGLPVDWAKIPDQLKALKMAVHCAINGPVGVGKATNFPGIEGEIKIKENLGSQKVTNNGWKQLVRVVAEAINKKQPQLQCNQRRQKGDLWPLYPGAD